MGICERRPDIGADSQGQRAGAVRDRLLDGPLCAVLERMVAEAEKLGGTRPNIFIDVSQVSKLDTFRRAG